MQGCESLWFRWEGSGLETSANLCEAGGGALPAFPKAGCKGGNKVKLGRRLRFGGLEFGFVGWA